jgi:lipid-binding SYLF domain-containing protein
MDQRIPFHLFNDVKGMMFISVVKGGIGVGGLLGTGIIMAHNPNWRIEWSAPCAIALGGFQIGLSIGIEKTDHIIFIRDENVITKFHSGISLGGDISMCMGPLGRDTNFGVTLNEKGALKNVSYSMSKGAYIGIALEGAVISVRNDCNAKYFGHECNVEQILSGSIKPPYNEDFNKLCKSVQSIHTTSNESHSNIDNLLKDEHHPVLNVDTNVKKA